MKLKHFQLMLFNITSTLAFLTAIHGLEAMIEPKILTRSIEIINEESSTWSSW